MEQIPVEAKKLGNVPCKKVSKPVRCQCLGLMTL